MPDPTMRAAGVNSVVAETPHGESIPVVQPPGLTAALALLTEGFWPVPIYEPDAVLGIDGKTPVDDPGKQPIGKGWAERRPTEASLRSHWHNRPGASVGLKLGVDGGIIDIEVDDPETGPASLATLFGGEEVVTRGYSSRRGPHFLLRYDARLAAYVEKLKTAVIKDKKLPGLPGIEIRIGAIPGRAAMTQSVVPPSPMTEKVDGKVVALKPREWNGVETIAELPQAFFDTLDRITAPPPAKVKPATAPPREVGKLAPNRGHDPVSQLTNYLIKIDGGIEGSGGSNPMFRAACETNRFGVSRQQAFDLLKLHYNYKCIPEWTDDQIWHKVDDAFNDFPEEHGQRLKERRNGHHSGNGKPPAPIVHSADDSGPEPLPSPAHGSAPLDRPIIITGSEDPGEGLKKWTPLALDALRQYNAPPRIFQRAGKLIRIKPAEDDTPPLIERLSVDGLRGELDRAASWGNEYITRKGPQIGYGPPRMDVVKDIGALPSIDPSIAPRLDSVVETPRFLPDGSLLRGAGYHPEANLYYAPAPGMELVDIPERPTAVMVEQARSLLLDDLLHDFTFANQASRAAALAFTLLPFVRSMIGGPTPLHHFGASTEGTGKTLLAICCAFPSLGRELNLSPQKENEGEWRKALTSMLTSGWSHYCIDNLANSYGWDGSSLPVDSSTLAMVLTTPWYTDRKLGGNEETRIKIQTIFASTGNNTAFSRELTRRIVPIDLVASIENPSLRTGFKHDPIVEGFIEPRRFDLLRACLTLCQHWIALGRPLGTQTMGRFESYARTMGGILDCIAVPGFLANRSKMIGRNPEGTRWTALVDAWYEKQATGMTTCSVLWDIITGTPDLGVAFADLLGDGTSLSQKQRLGKAVEKQVNQVWGGWRITPTSTKARNGSAVYRLKPASEPHAEVDDDPEDNEDDWTKNA